MTRRARLRRAVRRGAGAGAVVVLAAACHGGSASEGRPPSEPASANGAAAGLAPHGAGAGAGDAGTSGLEAGLPHVSPVLDDPRLAAAREREADRDWSGAAREVDAARTSASLDGALACAWSYLSGRLHLEAGENAEAAAAFERVASPPDAGAPCVLAPWAALREAEALVRVGRDDDALSCLRAMGSGTHAEPDAGAGGTNAAALGIDVPSTDEARLALADAYAAKGDRASAVPIWRALLEASPHGLRWADTSLRLAGALLDGVDGPAETHAQEALDLATRVLVETPWVADKVDVIGLRARAASALHKAAAPPLTPEDRARQAQAWLDTRPPDRKRAMQSAEALLQALPRRDKAHAPAACSAATLRAQMVPHGKIDEAADAWGVAIARCEGDDALPAALYHGGKASAAAHRHPEALARFAELEKRFPTNHLADDARFREALVRYDDGDEAKYESTLASVADGYPDGDMKGEALFRLALARLGKRDFDGARSTLDRLLGFALRPDAAERATYYRARVAQLAGDLDDAKTRYASLVAGEPLSFYMLLAYGRLRALDESAARQAIDAAVAREPSGPFLTRPHPELSSPAFARFERLLEVGDVDTARREAAAAGLTGEGADPEIVWAVAWMYDRAGVPELGHSFARARLVGFRTHWPAGRWRLPWEVAYPRPWDGVVLRESQASGIPVPLTWAIMREESAFIPDAHSPANAVGLMQLMTGTARLVARSLPSPPPVVDEPALERPEVSIELGTRYLATLRASFPANPALAIAAYNGGAGSVRRWLADRGAGDFDVFVERIPFDETRNYIKHVLSSEAAYAYLYAPKALDELLALPLRASGQEMVASP